MHRSPGRNPMGFAADQRGNVEVINMDRDSLVNGVNHRVNESVKMQ